MTAEQALIREHQKDPRVRYITEDTYSIDLWSRKPYFDAESNEWTCIIGAYIKSLDYQVFDDFRDKDNIDSILCIDDIKPEVPPIPEKWYLPINEKTIDFINEARIKKNKLSIYESKLDFNQFEVVVSVNGLLIGSNISYCISLGREEITLEQFKKYVLKEDVQEEKTIENHPIMSIAESEREESQKEQEENHTNIFESIFLTQQMARYFSEIGIPVNSILKNALGFESERVSKMISNNEIYLKYFFVQLAIFIENLKKDNTYLNKQAIEQKVKSINESIEKNCESWACIPPEWVNERNELIEQLNNL